MLKKKWDSIPLTVKISVSYTICSILQRCLSIVTLPLFARLLTTEQYGQSTVYNSWIGIFTIFLTLNLSYGSFGPAMIKYENDREGYISSVEGICIILSAVFLLIYFPFRNRWNLLLDLPTSFVVLLVAQIFFSNVTHLWSGRNRYEYKYKNVIAVTLTSSVLTIIVSLLLVINSEEKGYARILGVAIVSIIFGVVLFVRSLIKGRKLYDKEYWNYAFRFNIPLLVYYLSQSIFNQSDRIMISHIVGKDKAGIYGVAYSLGLILTFVLNAINNSYVPWYYAKIKEGKQEENRTVSIGIALLLAILLSGIIWFAPEIILIMAGQQYVEAKYVVPPVAISLLLLFYSQLFINVEFYYEEKKKLVGASVFAAVVNFGLNYVFIRIFGYIAAAYTTMVSYMIFAYSNYKTMRRLLVEREIKDTAYNYQGLVLILIVLCLLSVCAGFLYGNLLIRIITIIIGGIGVFVERKYFIDIYKIVKKKSILKR